MPKVYREIVTERFCGHIIGSSFVEASDEEVSQAKQDFQATSTCTHELFRDEPGWMYDIRHCVVCGAGLGTV